ncbi:uncharacterized protein LOC121417123 [Lytechinus variegatus]|uniref:uncharacterized protein LOC121417123 n=1 Tax=Lytechinus variegatus TaxID=7654 RepID=UPI001BB1EC24|nr:uncharacterized protein LOC121417123 [Lytechinus variegatus]
MDSDSVKMETDDDDSSLEEEEEEEGEECEPKQEVWVQSSSDSKNYKPVHLNISYQMGSQDSATHSGNGQQAKRNKGSDPTALAVLRRLTPELQQGYRILIDLMGDRCKSFSWPFMDKVDPVLLKLPDYYDRIKTPMWLTRIEEKFEDMEYTSITEFVADVRQILENCYRYNGLKHSVSRQAQMMECHFEQKLSQLSRHIKDKTNFHVTSGPQLTEPETSSSSMFGRRVSQRILESKSSLTPVADAMVKQLEREEEERRKQRIIERKAELERLNKRLLEWEKTELLVEPLATQLKSMWEIPAIGQFLKLCCENMYLPEFSIFELERALILPQSSKLLARIFTNILTTRYHRKRVSKKPPMPYEFWQDKLRKNLDVWYAFLSVETATRQSVARHLYISERFFEVLGDVNPLTGRQYHDLSIYERVWILKGMCDHLFETDYDVWFGVDTSTIEDQRVVMLGEDDDKASYLYFPHFLSTDLRIYRQAQIREEKPKKKKAEKEAKSPSKKAKKEAESASEVEEGPKKRGRPRKNAEPDEKSPKKAAKTPATPASAGPKKRGRPRKDAGETSESETTTSKGKETGGEAKTPSQATPGVKAGRGRPRKDGSTPAQAAKKTPAKPMAIVTPTRRSSRRSARLDKPELEEQDEKSQNGGDNEDVTDAACDSQNNGTNVEDKDQKSDRTVCTDGPQSSSVCDDSLDRTENEAGTLSREIEEGADNLDNKHLETISTKDIDNVVDGLPGSDEGRTQKSGVQGGEARSTVEGDSPNSAGGKSPSENVLCNGVMEVDDSSHETHSNDAPRGPKDDGAGHSGDLTKPTEEITNGPDAQVSPDTVQTKGESVDETHQLENGSSANGMSTLNQNQSNNVMDIDHKVAQLSENDISKDPCSNGMDIVDNVINDCVNNSKSVDTEATSIKSNNLCQEDCSVDKDVGAQDGQTPQERSEKDSADAANGPSVAEGEALPEVKAEVAVKDETMEVVEGDLKGNDLKQGDLKQDDLEQDDVKPDGEVMERIPTPPPPQPLPGILPPEGEFEMVCDSLETFRVLVEKFAQKDETITKGRKTIVQPIKRSGRTTDLHRTLAKMLEDLEPIEAKLQKVVHKAREVVYNEQEAYKKDPSPDQEAAAYWYQLHVKKPSEAVETSSIAASSIDDDFSSSESSSELDSDELSDQESDDDTAEYDNSDADYEASVSRGPTPSVEVNGSEGSESLGGKVDLYSGVEIAGRTMRSSKRRRAQKREDIRDRKKAKRSKIQIVKGVPLQGRYAQRGEVEETDETKLKKVHEELKEKLKAGSTFQMTKNMVPGAAQRNFPPYKKNESYSRPSAPKKKATPVFQRDTSDKFIRILKRTAGASEAAAVSPIPKLTKQSPKEPTLKVPFLQKTKATVQPTTDAPVADKKTKTETFSFTIDAKVWESLKDKPEERQRLIVEHVEKMRGASGQKKEMPQKVQNYRNTPWFSNKGSGSSKSTSSAGGSAEEFSLSLPETPEKRLHVAIGNASQGQTGSPVVKQTHTPGIPDSMPILDPIGSHKGSVLQNTNMPTLAPAVSQKIVQSNILGSPGSVSVPQQALAQTQGLLQPRSGNQPTAIASSGNNSIIQSNAVGTNFPGGTGTKGMKPQATIISLSPKQQGVQQLVSPTAQDIKGVPNIVAQLTAGASSTGAEKTVVLPTNLKVNMQNKQYKILYVQKPGASKPELCLQPCNTDGSTALSGTLQGSMPLVSLQQPIQPIPAATSGRNVQIQMLPQGGNKIVMQAVGGTPQGLMVQNTQQPQVVQNLVSQNVLQAQALQNVVLQSPVAAPQVVNPAAGSNTSVVTMISTPIPPVPPVSVISAPSVQMAPSIQVPSAVSPLLVAPPVNQTTMLAGSPSKAAPNQMVHLLDSGIVGASGAPTMAPAGASSLIPSLAPPMLSPVTQQVTPLVPSDNVILQAASASGLLLQAPEPSMQQIAVKGLFEPSGQ